VQRTVVIDFLAESVCRYRTGWAIVVVDVIRATTTAITAAAAGWRCFPVPTISAALALAQELDNPLLAGESGGDIPAGFEMDNSPAELAARNDTHRPLVLVSSSGTRVIHEAAGCEAVYLSCFRSYSVLADYLAGRHARIAVIGAGSKGEFREEDQACCAWVAARLASRGYFPYNPETAAMITRWSGEPAESCLCSRSVSFLKRTNRLRDLDFIFLHLDDLPAAFEVRNGEVQMIHHEEPLIHAHSAVRRGEQPARVLQLS
jgi:2-phosphosulfolactate phosphatase